MLTSRLTTTIQLALGNIEFNDADNVAEAISDAIEDLFNVIPADED